MNDPYWPDFNDLWDYGDPVATESLFRGLVPGAKEQAGASVEARSYYLQLLTQLARTLSLQKEFDQAHQVLDQVQEEMDSGDLVEVRYLLERGRTINSAGEPERALPLFSRAAELGERLGVDFYTVDALHMLGIAASPSERLHWNLEAIALAENSPEDHARGWMGSLCNNTGWALFDEGRYGEALELFEKALAFREDQGDQEQIDIARWCVAKTMRVMGRVHEALEIQRELEDPETPDGFVEEEIAECLYALGQVEEARPYFAVAYEVLSGIDWVADDTERLQRLRALSEG